MLRVAPEPAQQYRAERELMRNEHAALPFFAPVAHLMPRTLAADFTHDLIGRDYLWQTLLPGTPARQHPQWRGVYRALGELTRTVHQVRGRVFGPVGGPHFPTWSEAVLASFADVVADLTDIGLDASDVRAVAGLAAGHRAVLDEITRPRLLHGDLWTGNVLLSPAPAISGLLDHDRARWGDPTAEWGLHLADMRDEPSFWDGYGPRPATPRDRWRGLVYRAWHIALLRLERYRLGRRGRVAASYAELGRTLRALLSHAV